MNSDYTLSSISLGCGTFYYGYYVRELREVYHFIGWSNLHVEILLSKATKRNIFMGISSASIVIVYL